MSTCHITSIQTVKPPAGRMVLVLQIQPTLSLPSDYAGFAVPEQADGSHQGRQGGDYKEQDEDDPVVVQHAFV